MKEVPVLHASFIPDNYVVVDFPFTEGFPPGVSVENMDTDLRMIGFMESEIKRCSSREQHDRLAVQWFLVPRVL